MIAYKFLAAGGRGPFSGFAWPLPSNGEPGAWVDAEGDLVPCSSGVHACTVETLPTWVHDELWRVELDVEVVHFGSVLVARRGRLVERVPGWTLDSGQEFANACAQRIRDRAAASTDPLRVAYADFLEGLAEAANDSAGVSLTAYGAAHAVDESEPGMFKSERAWQARWLAERLGL